jgi:hypothetical protein
MRQRINSQLELFKRVEAVELPLQLGHYPWTPLSETLSLWEGVDIHV